jgi:hypothetical protein
MGKLFTGHYGRPPEAESVPLPLADASQKLGLKPSDFVSEGPPAFFHKAFGAPGRYLVFLTEPEEIRGSPVWKLGHYLLPLAAADVLKTLEKSRQAAAAGGDHRELPIRAEIETAPPPDVRERLDSWVAKAQPLFFKCGCDHLELKVVAPWGLRRRWKARLRCPARCQPALLELF